MLGLFCQVCLIDFARMFQECSIFLFLCTRMFLECSICDQFSKNVRFCGLLWKNVPRMFNFFRFLMNSSFFFNFFDEFAGNVPGMFLEWSIFEQFAIIYARMFLECSFFQILEHSIFFSVLLEI